MKELDQWQRLDADSISPLKQAKGSQWRVAIGNDGIARPRRPRTGLPGAQRRNPPRGVCGDERSAGEELLTGVGVRALATWQCGRTHA